MLPIGSIAGDFAAGLGVVAGMIAVAGFIAHAPSVLSDASDREIQQATVAGGLVGCVVAVFVIVLSAIES
jgi:hypothetical protein